MNTYLTEQIIRHIFSNLKIIHSEFVNSKAQSIMNKEFLLDEKLSFQIDDESVINNKVWGCQFLIENQNLKILLADASTDNITKEYCVIIHLQNSPMYGMYLIVNADESDPLISCSVNGKEWMQCSTYLEATFLAAMEQIKNHIVFPQKCEDYKTEYSSLLSFIESHAAIFEDKYEGEES